MIDQAHKYGIMGFMKTTLEIPDQLFRQAKAEAAKRGLSLKTLINVAIQKELKPINAIPSWRKLAGRFPSSHFKEINQFMNREHSKIDEKVWADPVGTSRQSPKPVAKK
jgi:hypothetical protein